MCHRIPAETDQKSTKPHYCNDNKKKTRGCIFIAFISSWLLPAGIWIYRETNVYIWRLLLIFKQLFDSKFTLFMVGLNTQSWRVPFPGSLAMRFTFHLWLPMRSGVSQSEAGCQRVTPEEEKPHPHVAPCKKQQPSQREAPSTSERASGAGWTSAFIRHTPHTTASHGFH